MHVNAFAKDTDKFVLLNIPAGKPNRKAKEPTRVLQSAQKGDTCFYYNAKLSAVLEQDYISQQNVASRKFASEYRKALSKLTSIEKNLWEIVGLALQSPDNKLNQALSLITVLKALTAGDWRVSPGNRDFILQLLPKLIVKFTGINSEKVAVVLASVHHLSKAEEYMNVLISTFSNIPMQFKTDLKECLLEVKDERLQEIASDFLTKLGLDPVKELAEYLAFRESPAFKAYHEIKIRDVFTRGVLLKNTADHKVFKIFDLRPISWSPNEPIQKLFNLIKAGEAPVTVGGYFGNTCYTKEPLVYESLPAYQVLYWEKGCRKKYEGGGIYSHVISVVGLKVNENKKINSEGFVYYVDPMDESNPILPRKIYMISYEQFKQNCAAMLELPGENIEQGELIFGRQRRSAPGYY